VAPLGYLEVLDQKGKVSARFAIGALPVTIGRAYTNQVILDDPFVCPEHVTIGQSEAGQLIVDDLGSVNGLRAGENAKPVQSLPLHSGDKFRIGHTTLRYCAVDTAVAAAQVDRLDLFSRFAAPYFALSGGLLVMAALALNFFLGSFERVTLLRILSEPLVTLSMMGVWAGVWSFVSRIVFGRLYFTQHFLIVCVAMLASLLLNESAEWTEFFLPSSQALWAASVIGSAAILAAAVFGHLRFASSMRWPSRLGAGLLASLVVIGLGVVTEYASREKFSTVMDYSGMVKPIDTRLLPASALDGFMRRTQSMKKELDQLAQKAKSAQP
jgi:hypothetical protein